MTTDQLLSPDDVADLLDVSTNTLAKWRKDGDIDLPFLKINGRVKYRESDVSEFLEAMESDEENDDDDDEVGEEEEEEDIADDDREEILG